MKSRSTRSLMTINMNELKERQKNYDFHVRKIMEIQNDQHHRLITEEQGRFANHLKKSKQIARKFKNERQMTKRHEQDRKMIQTLIQIQKKPRIKSEFIKQKERLSSLPSKTVSKEKFHKQEKIETQNVRLAQNIMTSASGIKQYKKKMRTQIDEYIRLRTHLQKIKPIETGKRPQKARKIIKTSNELMQLIKQKTEEIQKNKVKNSLEEVKNEQESFSEALDNIK